MDDLGAVHVIGGDERGFHGLVFLDGLLLERFVGGLDGEVAHLDRVLEDDGEVSVEIVDLRSIVPCDYETVTKSVGKTGRLVVLCEDNRTGSFAQTVVAEMTGKPERWNLFLSPPQTVAREDVPIGFHPTYEYAALPSVEEIVAAIRLTME